MSIEKELVKLTGVKAKKGEDRQEFLRRLVEATMNLDDDVWDTISHTGQEWANQAATAYNDGDDKEIPEFPDADDDDDAPEAEESEDAAEESEPETKPAAKKKAVKAGKADANEKPAKPKKAPAKPEKKADKPAKSDKPEKKAAKADKPAKPEKKAKPDKGEKEKRGGANGVKVRIKKLLVKKPDMSVDDLMAALSKDGGQAPSPMTLSNIRAEFRHSLKVLRELNLLADSVQI